MTHYVDCGFDSKFVPLTEVGIIHPYLFKFFKKAVWYNYNFLVIMEVFYCTSVTRRHTVQEGRKKYAPKSFIRRSQFDQKFSKKTLAEDGSLKYLHRRMKKK